MSPDSIALIHTEPGYPEYFIMFIGIAEFAGVIGVLIPGYPLVKERAYDGLFFDLTAATISGIVVDGLHPMQLFMLVFFAPDVLSYIIIIRKLKGEGIKHPV